MTEGPVVTIKQGTLKGKVIRSPKGEKINCFLGIPYGQPPTGGLRFKPPLPAKGWNGVREAIKEGSECLQVQMLTKKISGDEDCLFLNIATPDIDFNTAYTKKLPVMVHIHGGGFINGSGNFDLFSPDFLLEQDVILVSINYRLNILGFLCLDIPEAPGNLGLKDQNLALRWVKNNIESFGGDPNNITLFGISAGAAAAEYHVLSPMSKGLFDKVILQSGSALCPWVRSRDPVNLVKRVIELLGGKYENPDSAFEFLKTKTSEDLVRASFHIKNESDAKMTEFFLFSPVVEKKFPGTEQFLTEEPIKLIKEGRFTILPTLTGFCDKEGVLFKYFYDSHVVKLKQHRYIDYLPPYFYNDRDATDEKLRSIYKKSFDDTNPDDFVNNFLSDMLFIGAIITSLQNRVKYSDYDNYLYQFSYDGKLNYLKIAMNFKEQGAIHGDDLTYLSKAYYMDETNAKPRDMKVRERMVQMWTDFAKYGNPTPAKTSLIKSIWKPVTEEKLCMMDIGSELVMRSDPMPERIKLWQEFYRNLHEYATKNQ